MAKESDGIPPLVIVIVGLCVAVGIAYFCFPRLNSSPIWNNESAAIAALSTYLRAQTKFRRKDRYGVGKKVYANTRNGAGFADLYQIGGPGSESEQLKLIDIIFVEATVGGRPKAGYLFGDITAGADGPYDPETDCGLCAVPARYNRTGRNMFIVDVTGTVYQKDAAVVCPGVTTGDTPPPLTVWPDATELSSWIQVGE